MDYWFKLNEEEEQVARLIPELIQDRFRQHLIVQGKEFASSDELLAGWKPRNDSWEDDCRHWSRDMNASERRAALSASPPGALPAAITRCLRALEINASRAGLLALKRAASKPRRELNHRLLDRIERVDNRADIYLWLSGDRDAADRCLLIALRRLRHTIKNSMRLGLLRRVLESSTGLTPGNVAGFAQAVVSGYHVQSWSGFDTEDMQAWLRGYQVAKASEEGALQKVSVDEDEEFIPLDDWLEDRTPPAPKGMVVLASLSHLPGKNTGGDSPSFRGHTPRNEYGHLAGKELPLVNFNGDVLGVMRGLLGAFPWAEDVVETVFFTFIGQPFIRLPPIMLLGDPGGGKTSLAMAIGNQLGCARR